MLLIYKCSPVGVGLAIFIYSHSRFVTFRVKLSVMITLVFVNVKVEYLTVKGQI